MVLRIFWDGPSGPFPVGRRDVVVCFKVSSIGNGTFPYFFNEPLSIARVLNPGLSNNQTAGPCTTSE